MATQQFTVEVQPDFIERQAKARPIDALGNNLNGLDADATTVDVRLGHNEFGLSSIAVTDNGHGIPHAEASTLFTRLGGSWHDPPHLAPNHNRITATAGTRRSVAQSGNWAPVIEVCPTLT